MIQKISCLLLMLGFIVLMNKTCYAQIKDIGLPFITNYRMEDYHAETQNWGMTQDDQNIVYFANNSGVLSFNGNTWELYPLPNNSIVRSVRFIDNKLYAGGFNEFGYFEKMPNGGFNYHSLSNQLGKEYRNFDDIWRIFKTPEGIVFQSQMFVFIFGKTEVKVLEPKSRFGFSYLVDSTVFVIDREFGIYSILNSRLNPVYMDERLFLDNDITFILKGKDKEWLVGTTNKGIYTFDQKNLVPWNKQINEQFIKNQTYTGIELNTNQIAIGTIQNGMYIITKDGNVVQHLNRSRGLQNNTVLSLFFDNYKNLWLGLDNGIDMLEVNSPITLLNYSYDIETSYTSLVFHDILYIGTNQGLFAKKVSEVSNNNLLDSKFQKIPGTLGQVWKLKIIDGKLWCGHNFGTFIINGFKAESLSHLPGGWDFVEIPWNTNYAVGGNYSGLELFKKNSSTIGWESLGAIKGIKESCKDLVFDNNQNLWITHGLKGVFKVTLSDNLREVSLFRQYDASDGLPNLPYSIASIKNQFYLLASDSLFSFNSGLNRFEYNGKVTELLKGLKGITRIVEDQGGDIWFFTSSGMGVLRLMEDGSYIKITKPFLRMQNLYLSNSFENIYNFNKSNTFIGSKTGMLHYSLISNIEGNTRYNTYLSEVKIKINNTDTTQQANGKMEQKIDLTNSNIVVPYKYNSISFKYFSAFFEGANSIEHSCRLQGFDKEWSAWNNANFKEYTNLHEGLYVFEVKAINIYNSESIPYRFSFTIKPPFYRTLFAYVFYVLAFLAIVVLNVIYFKHKVEKTRQLDKIKHTEELVLKEQQFKEEVKQSEEKIEKLEQEKLKNEMRHKNIELANSTMNLIQKTKLLTNLKAELLDVADKAISESVKRDLRQINVRIDKAIKNDQNFKVFDKYFEVVHQDFINRLKEKHPDITPKDVRLCAYLRMNLETKEIAPLMNISTRGLEISRYRLRKKFELGRDVNLVDYIMKI